MGGNCWVYSLVCWHVDWYMSFFGIIVCISRVGGIKVECVSVASCIGFKTWSDLVRLSFLYLR